MSEKFYQTKESVALYLEMAKDASGKEMIEEFNLYLDKGAEVLEVGSGPGTDWNILNEKYQVIGSDYSEEFLHHLRTSNPEGEFIQLDAALMNTEKVFDAIYSNKVLHHLTDDQLKQSIQGQLDILRPAGIICHSFWKGKNEETFKGMLVNYHTQEELKELFSSTFDVLVLKEYQEFEENDSILLIARKK
jgi:SAM-dependent methyltransferase